MIKQNARAHITNNRTIIFKYHLVEKRNLDIMCPKDLIDIETQYNFNSKLNLFYIPLCNFKLKTILHFVFFIRYRHLQQKTWA